MRVGGSLLPTHDVSHPIHRRPSEITGVGNPIRIGIVNNARREFATVGDVVAIAVRIRTGANRLRIVLAIGIAVEQARVDDLVTIGVGHLAERNVAATKPSVPIAVGAEFADLTTVEQTVRIAIRGAVGNLTIVRNLVAVAIKPRQRGRVAHADVNA